MQCYLDQIYPPHARNVESKIDVIFVHGVNPKRSIDHARETWTGQDGVFWPETILPYIIPSARVLLYGYNSKASFDMNGDTFRYHAVQLLDRLLSKRSGQVHSSCPILFICHSLGGLIVKSALVLAQMNLDRYESIRTSTKGLIFFATPHSGGTGPSIAAPVANIFSLLTDKARNELLPKLINDPFFNRELTENFDAQKDDYQVRTFYETEFSNIRVKSWKIVPQYSSMLVVDRSSATYGGSRNGYPIPICDDHSGICKLVPLNQASFSTIKSNIEQVVRKILEQNEPTPLGPSTQALPPANPRYGTNAPRSLAIEEGSTSHVTEGRKRAFEQDSPSAKNLVPQIKTSHFIGRDSVLSDLEKYFDSSGKEGCRAVICGMAGVGKSQLSLEFSRRRHQNGYSVFWIEAQSLESLTHSYDAIAKELQLDCTNPVTSVTKWLRKASRSLLVFDHVDSLQTIEGFIPSAMVDVIITTRDSAFAGSEMFPYGISVPLLDENDAMALFILGLGAWSPADTAAIRNNPSGTLVSGTVSEVLSEKFGLKSVSELQQVLTLTDKLPLAIAQCASYLRQYPMPFRHYLEKFTAKAPEARRRFYSQPMKGAAYQHSVMTTWDISIDKLTPDAVKMITLFGFLGRIQIMMPFLEHALDDCQFWGGRVRIPLPDHLRQFFTFLDTHKEFYDCIGILDSLSLVKRDASKQQIYIHPMIHEYIHLRLPEEEAVLWLQRVTALLHHHLPPLLYSSYLDRNAAQQSEQVFLHLGRNFDLVELYQTGFSEVNANDSAAFFLEAHLWYRGSRYLDLAERLITASTHPWDAEMIYGSKLLGMIFDYQANPGKGINPTLIDEYANKIHSLPSEGRERPPGSKATLCQAAFSHRWIDAILSNKRVSVELQLALIKIPWFTWQSVDPKLSQAEGDRVAAAVSAHTKARALVSIGAQSQEDPEDQAVRLLWQMRENALLGLECKCSELDYFFDDMLKYQMLASSRRRGPEDVETLIKQISFYRDNSAYLRQYLDRRWNNIETALAACTKDSGVNEISKLAPYMLEDESFVNRLLSSSSFRKLMFPDQSNEERWLKEKIHRLETYHRSEKQMLIRRLKARLAEILVETGSAGVNEARTIIQSIFMNLVSIADAPGNDLASFAERLLEPVLDAEAFHANAAFNQQVIDVLLSLKTEQADALVRHWAGNVYSMLEEGSPHTVLPNLCGLLIPHWDYTDRRSTLQTEHSMDILDRFGFFIINLPGSADVWPITSLRAYHLSSDICKELQARGNLGEKRLREWIAKIDDFDGLFGRFGSWRDMPITARDINEITRAGIRLQRCASTEELVQKELFQRSYDRGQLEASFRQPLPELTALQIALQPTFVRLPLGRVLGTTTQIVAASYHGPRCGLWITREMKTTETTRSMLFWTRPERAGVFYLDITDVALLNRWFNSWLLLQINNIPSKTSQYCLFQLHYVPYGDWRFVASGRSIMEQFRAVGGQTWEHEHPSQNCKYSWEGDAIAIPILDSPPTMEPGRNSLSPASVSLALPPLLPPKTMDWTILRQAADSTAQASTQARVTGTVRDVSAFEKEPKNPVASRAVTTGQILGNALSDGPLLNMSEPLLSKNHSRKSDDWAKWNQGIGVAQTISQLNDGFMDGALYKAAESSSDSLEQPRTFDDLNNTCDMFLNFKEGDKYRAGDDIIKIAILDTGFDGAHDDMAKPRAISFKDGEPVRARAGERIKIDRIIRWKDFCQESNSSDSNTMEDLDGHGTQVAGIVLRLAPRSQLLIARVCHGNVNHGLVRTDKEWLNEEDKAFVVNPGLSTVIDAIDWAIEEGASIINMSFGFKKASLNLEKALERARRHHVLVFAAMANEGMYEGAAWPARESTDAIGIHSCKKYGKTSSKFTPMPVADNKNFMVVGEDIVVHRTQRKGGGFCYAKGTSFATPVAVSMAANILAFANQTGADCKAARQKSEKVVDTSRLWTNEGMIKVLDKCSDEALERSQQGAYRWIDPKLLWKTFPDDDDDDKVLPPEHGWRTITRGLRK